MAEQNLEVKPDGSNKSTCFYCDKEFESRVFEQHRRVCKMNKYIYTGIYMYINENKYKKKSTHTRTYSLSLTHAHTQSSSYREQQFGIHHTGSNTQKDPRNIFILLSFII